MWMIIAIEKNNRRKGSDLGVLKAKHADGFYDTRETALGVAEYIAEEAPDCDVYIVSAEDPVTP